MEKMFEKLLRETYKDAVKVGKDAFKKNSKSEKAEEAFGNAIIGLLKLTFGNFFKSFKVLKNDFKNKKTKCRKLLMFLAIALVAFIASCITIEVMQITIYAIYVAAFASALIPSIYMMILGSKSKSPRNTDYSKLMEKVGLFEGGFSRVKIKGEWKTTKATPRLVKIEKINNFTTYTFETNIVIDDWLKAKNKMKSVFNSEILSIYYAEKSYNRVIVEMATIGSDKLPKEITWKDEYYKKGKITLGMGAGNKIIRLDITKTDTVHALIAGLPGAGKTILSLKLLNDCCLNGYYIEILDRKDGIDYVHHEALGVKVSTTLDDILTMTINAVKELDARLVLFKKAEMTSLEDYNKVAKIKLARYVIIIDEASEVFSSETEKKTISLIKENITSIARRGRALGMNLIIMTQKCSAIVISTEIRNLLGTRICGYVSTASDSRQILDNNYAAGLPKISGRFTQRIHDKFEDFQAFYLPGKGKEAKTIIYKIDGALAIPRTDNNNSNKLVDTENGLEEIFADSRTEFKEDENG